jgi:hypothetical protein
MPQDREGADHQGSPTSLNQPSTFDARASDFLRTNARTPLHQVFLVAGRGGDLWTNSDCILKAACQSFLPIDDAEATVEFRMRFWVDEEDENQSPWPKPYVRGLGHLAFAGFGSGSSVLIDLRTHRMVGRFSSMMGSDQAYWKAVIFPMLLSIVAGSVGIAEVHSACVAKSEHGLLLAGPSGSGKSTLSVALSQKGFGFLSDDRTYCSLRQGKLFAWSLATQLKLRRETSAWFPELRDSELSHGRDEEWVFRCQPEDRLRLSRIHVCKPRWLVFLEQKKDLQFKLNRIEASAAANLLKQDLIAELPEAVEKQSEVIDKLLELPCWLLRYGGSPLMISSELARRFDGDRAIG